MDIAIIGTGSVGAALGKAWGKRGHAIFYGVRDVKTSKGAAAAVRGAGAKAKALSVAEAVKVAPVILLAVPWPAAKQTIGEMGDLKGKVVIDCINPVKPDLSGLELGLTTSAAEEIAGWAKGASVFKALNQTGAANLESPAGYLQKPVMFVCGDDAKTKPKVIQLVQDAGFEAVDAGLLNQARNLEPLALLWVQLAIKQGLGTDFAYALVRR